MKLYFYTTLLLLAGTSLYAMEENNNNKQATIPVDPQQNSSTSLSSQLEHCNLNPFKEKIITWNPSKSLSASELAQQRNALYDAIKKPNFARFQNAYQNYPAEFRNVAVINVCGNTCYRAAIALESKKAIIDKQLMDGKKHDTRNLVKYSLIETGLSALCLLTWFIPTTYEISNNYRLAFDNPLLIKSSFVLLTAMLLSKPFYNSAIAIKKAWNYQDTQQKEKSAITESLKEIPTIMDCMEKTKNDWINNARLDFTSLQKEADIK